MGLSKKSDFPVFVIPVLRLQFVQIPESPDLIYEIPAFYPEGTSSLHSGRARYSRYDKEITFRTAPSLRAGGGSMSSGIEKVPGLSEFY
jgi:hypothetical protein